MSGLVYIRSVSLDPVTFQGGRSRSAGGSMLQGDSGTQAPSSCSLIIHKGLEPMEGEQDHKGSMLLSQKFLTLHWLEVSWPVLGHSYLQEELDNTA